MPCIYTYMHLNFAYMRLTCGIYVAYMHIYAIYMQYSIYVHICCVYAQISCIQVSYMHIYPHIGSFCVGLELPRLPYKCAFRSCMVRRNVQQILNYSSLLVNSELHSI